MDMNIVGIAAAIALILGIVFVVKWLGLR